MLPDDLSFGLRKPSQLLATREIRHRHLDRYPSTTKWLNKELAVAMACKHHDAVLICNRRQKLGQYLVRPFTPLLQPESVERVIVGRNFGVRGD